MVTTKRYDSMSYRLMEDDKIVGFALQLANGRWGLFKSDSETRIGTIAYDSLGAAVHHFNQLSS
jgi:hypothetical protein